MTSRPPPFARAPWSSAAFGAGIALAACVGPTVAPDAAVPRDAPALRDAGQDAGPRCSPATGLPPALACNGAEALCDRTYDAVSYPTTHNAMSNEEDRWRPPNQGPNLWHQLEDGVRGFMLDTYAAEDGTPLLCHGVCGVPFGQRPLADALADLREFMDCHPTEVITLILESHLPEAPTARAFEDTGLLPYLHAQPPGAPWPTLRAMIEGGRRLVVFTESADVTLPWHHHAYAYAWDNDYAATDASDFDCAVNRGASANALFVLNHFLTAPVAMRSLAASVNFDPVLSAHVERCRTETGRRPNFVTVDFYDTSDLFSVVRRLNGL